MNVPLELYRVLYYVVKSGGITAASEKLFISQSAVSQSVKQLEELHGCKLFLRTSKGVRLTREGEELYKSVSIGYEKILEGEKRLRDMLNFESGEIRIGASDMTLRFFLLPYLEKFNKRYPAIRIHITNAPTPTTLTHLQEGVIDFGVVSTPFHEKSEFSVYPVLTIRDIFIAGSSYKALKNKVNPLTVLETNPIICLEKNTSTRAYVDAFFAENQVKMEPEFEIATSDLIVSFAERNLGIGIVVESFAEKSLKKEKCFRVTMEKELPPRKICIVTSSNNPVSRAAQALLKEMDINKTL